MSVKPETPPGGEATPALPEEAGQGRVAEVDWVAQAVPLPVDKLDDVLDFPRHGGGE